MSGLLEALNSVPTPAGKAKRPKLDNKKNNDEDNQQKLVMKCMSLLLSENRNTNSRCGTTLLLPAEHKLTKALEGGKSAYGDYQPVREPGKPGTAHPWGAPRHVFVALMFEVTISEYNDKPQLVEDAKLSLIHI